MKRIQKGVLALSLVSVAACQDLTTINENRPDIQRALSEPADVETIVRSAWNIWYNRLNGNSDVYYYYPLIADETTQTTTVREIIPAAEPRVELKNDPLGEQVWLPRAPWDGFASTAANVNDGLRVVKGGMKIMTQDPDADEPTDNTNRLIAFGKFMQGTGLGYLALTMDQATPATEDTNLPEEYDKLVIWERENLKKYPEMMTFAIQQLEAAIAKIDSSDPFTLPSTWINGQALTSAQLKQAINTQIARLLVYNARTPEERAAVNWAKVLTVTAAGLTYDFGPTLASGVTTSTYLDRIQGTSRMRADYKLVGPADVSGNYQAWLAKPLAERDRFLITTPDRRITGATPTSNGSYFRYTSSSSGQDLSRGLYMLSYYQWYRKAGAATTGQHVVMSVDENRLLRAEAMYRTNNLTEAANLINVSRTRSQRIGSTTYPGLPAVTAAGVPQSATCVPRKENGACGDLLDALMYERLIELAGQDPIRAWVDKRGFGTLTTGTPLQMPIPARYLVSMGLPLYTFGGVGGPGAAK